MNSNVNTEIAALQAEKELLLSEIAQSDAEIAEARSGRRREADKQMGDAGEYADRLLSKLRQPQTSTEVAETFLMYVPILSQVTPTPETRSLTRKLLIQITNFIPPVGHFLPDSTLEELRDLVREAHAAQWSPFEGLPEGETEQLIRQLVAYHQAGRHMWVELDLHEYFARFNRENLDLLASLLEGRDPELLRPLRLQLAIVEQDATGIQDVLGGEPETVEDAWNLVLALADTGLAEETRYWAKQALEMNPDDGMRNVLRMIISESER